MKRNKNGTFSRIRDMWTPENWNDGYLDNRGRFRVYRPDYPRAYKEGYAMRSHVVYWLETGQPHPKGTELHHKDGTKDNDRFDNLVVLRNSEHQSEHRQNWVDIVCSQCGKTFREHKWRVTQRKVRFCSQDCFHKYPKSSETKRKQSSSLKLAYKEGRR